MYTEEWWWGKRISVIFNTIQKYRIMHYSVSTVEELNNFIFHSYYINRILIVYVWSYENSYLEFTEALRNSGKLDFRES